MCISNIGNRRPYPASAVNVLQQQQQQLKDLSNEDSDVIAEPSPKQAQHHITVQHDYHDHSQDNAVDYEEEHPVRGGVTTPFPLKLHDMLNSTSAEGMEDVVSWQPHGRCFVVHKPKEFVTMLPQYFKLSKLASFQRQLNLYGFQRLTRGRDRGGYYHELFLRDRVFLSHSIQRSKVKGTGVRARSNPDQEPDFWAMPWVSPNQCKPYPTKSLSQLPLEMKPTVLISASMISSTVFDAEDDLLLDAFSKPFHYLDPFQPTSGNWTISGIDALLEKEADAFFNDFSFDDTKIDDANVEDDAIFGDLLEQMIA